MTKFQKGQIVYIVASDRIIQEVTVKEINGKDYKLSFELGGMITMPEERIFSRQQEAESKLRSIREQKQKVLTYTDKIKARML